MKKEAKNISLRYSTKTVLYKVDKFFGPGVVTLLEHVDETHSLSKASKMMSLAYTKALKIIKTAEANLGYPLLVRQTGGISGGGSKLTENAHILIAEFTNFQNKIKSDADNHFLKLVEKLSKLKLDE